MRKSRWGDASEGASRCHSEQSGNSAPNSSDLEAKSMWERSRQLFLKKTLETNFIIERSSQSIKYSFNVQQTFLGH